MARQLIARFVVDRPVVPGMVRAILDTLCAQGGAYVPQLVRRASDSEPQRITWTRPGGLLHQIGEEGTQTTFLRVAEGRAEPLLSFSISTAPHSQPSAVTLAVPAAAIVNLSEVERVLGVCKGLYLFLESPMAVAGLDAGPADFDRVNWANFYGPEIVTDVGPSRLLATAAFAVEILPDGGIMLVSHATPGLADASEGRDLLGRLADVTGVMASVRSVLGRSGRSRRNQIVSLPRGRTARPRQ